MNAFFKITIAVLLLVPTVLFAADFESVVVAPNPNTVSDNAVYSINFRVSPHDLIRLYNGSIKIDFPSGFGLDEISDVRIRGKHSNYDSGALNFEINEQSLSVYLSKDDEIAASLVSPDTFYFSLILRIESIVNPGTPGQYQLAMTGYNAYGYVQISESYSDPFDIILLPNSGLTLIPDTAVTIQAGRTITFHAFAYDQYGMEIPSAQLDWSLLSEGDPIGYLDDSVFNATTVGQGRVVVSSPFDSDTSGVITVTPGNLSRIQLELEQTQIVNNDFRPVSQLTLYDSYNNIKDDYDLINFPLYITSDAGTITPSLLDDPNLLSNGTIDLSTIPIQYSGPTTLVNFTVSSDLISSNYASAYLNGYDILDVLGYSGNELNSVFVGHQTFVKIPIVNNGNLRATDPINITASFSSSDVYAFQIVTPPAPGVIDTILLSIPSVEGSQTEDTLNIQLSANFVVDSDTYFVNSSLSKVLEVVQTNTFTYVDGSFEPDTVLVNNDFDFSFQVDLGNLNLPIDSSLLTLSLLDPNSDSLIPVYNGQLTEYDLNENIITYHGSGALVDSSYITFNSQYYQLVYDYQLFSGGSLFKLEDEYSDSVLVIKDFGLTYIVGSFYPTQIYSGTDVRFHFSIDCDFAKTITFLPELSSFTIYDTGFSTTTRLSPTEDSVFPGETKFSTNVLSFQSHLIGSELLAMAELKYIPEGLSDTLTFVTNFPDPSFPIQVLTPPRVQVIDVEVISPNPPRININQNFQIKATVANTGTTIIDSLQVELVTVSGNSDVLEQIKDLSPIAIDDTTEIYFDITASSDVRALPESFRLDILSSYIVEDNPVNNSAIIFIENPANIELIFALDGAAYQNPIVAGYNDVVNLAIALNNIGDAKATDGTYELIVSGLNQDKPDTSSSQIVVDSLYTFSYRLPQYDTTVTIAFRLPELPIDINSGEPVQISDSVVLAEIFVTSTESELLIETTPLGSNLLLPGRPKEIASMTFTNTSTSEYNNLSLDEINVLVDKGDADIENLMSIFVSENTGFYEDGVVKSDISSDSSKLIFTFNHFSIAPGQSRTIIFQAELRENSLSQIGLTIDVENISATFLDGPNAGLPAIIASTGSSGEVLDVQMVVKSNELEKSFLIANNPFNPTLIDAEFSYELTSDSKVEFRIFTLTGEIVIERIYDKGANGGTSGENIVYWNGRNGEGDLVADGVYIAHLLIIENDETATIKVAVIK